MDSAPGASVSLLRRARDRFVADPQHGPLPGLLMLLTVVSGLVDAVSILRMGRVFVANMTGNLAFIGFGIAGARGISVSGSAAALGGFACGAVLTAWVPASWRPDRARLLRTSVVLKLFLSLPVFVGGIVLGISPSRPSTYVFSALLAASMGVQSAVARRLAVPDVTTTVVTTTLAALLTDLRRLGWRRSLDSIRMASVAFFFAGAAIGAVLVLRVNAVTTVGIAMLVVASVGLAADHAARRGGDWVRFSPA